LGALTALELDRAAAGLERIARGERLPVHRNLPSCNMDVALAASSNLELGALVAVEEAGVEKSILVHRDGALATVRRSNQPQSAAFLRAAKVLLLVRGRDAIALGLDPDLQEVRDALLLVVVFAVAHAGAGAHALHIS